MKTYKNTTYAVLAISLMVFFAAGQALAFMERGDLGGLEKNYITESRVSYASDPKISDPLDFNKGRNAGLELGKESINSCAVVRDGVDSEAKDASMAYLDENRNQEKTSEFLAGFDSGFKDSASLFNYSYCKI